MSIITRQNVICFSSSAHWYQSNTVSDYTQRQSWLSHNNSLPFSSLWRFSSPLHRSPTLLYFSPAMWCKFHWNSTLNQLYNNAILNRRCEAQIIDWIPKLKVLLRIKLHRSEMFRPNWMSKGKLVVLVPIVMSILSFNSLQYAWQLWNL